MKGLYSAHIVCFITGLKCVQAEVWSSGLHLQSCKVTLAPIMNSEFIYGVFNYRKVFRCSKDLHEYTVESMK